MNLMGMKFFGLHNTTSAYISRVLKIKLSTTSDLINIMLLCYQELILFTLDNSRLILMLLSQQKNSLTK